MKSAVVGVKGGKMGKAVASKLPCSLYMVMQRPLLVKGVQDIDSMLIDGSDKASSAADTRKSESGFRGG